jgi:hypothetical protein
MKRFRALARQSPAIVISLIALTFSLGSGAGYAASVAAHHPAATKITWHGLGLRNGWKAAAKGFGTGKPAYTVSNGVVYLTGAASRVNQSASIPSVVGVLPRGARPSHELWFQAYNYGATGQAAIGVYPNGDVQIWGEGSSGFAPGDVNYFTSLAGVQFPLGS